MIKALDLFVKALGLLPLLMPVIAQVQAATATDSDGGAKFTVAEIVTIVLSAVARIGDALADMLPAKPRAVIGKVMAVLPIVGDIVLEIDQATKPSSPGGKKLTPVEIATIAARGAERLGKAIADLFRDEG